ncbi:4-carboxymuconolactone decarboxylase [Sphingobium fontiphilum]|uniref:4-carboxymuconolactone decarboxylase n=1 Tax=Sphingobium fontiphilum TaxID=944425 RepID=A0A7W6DMZ4_9SPHN|nr:carboxymuconolactone decarboxylase family protein [Sphingobium fontiphilum]MBB3982813.1 4-carboxymuconolactone decarboxylase [Sphingobium fontiphilum]
MTDKWAKGIEMFDAVYGKGSSAMVEAAPRSPYLDETVEHLFGDIWASGELSMRDKRLMVIGATTMLGRADLLEIQIAGAILNRELTDAQFEEMKLLMLFYAGAGNTTALSRGIDMARKRAADMAAQ